MYLSWSFHKRVFFVMLKTVIVYMANVCFVFSHHIQLHITSLYIKLKSLVWTVIDIVRL